MSRPEIFFISLSNHTFLDEAYKSLIDKLAEKAKLKRAKSVDGTLRYLESNTPKAVMVTDEGGLVFIGLLFLTFIDVGKMNYFFTQHFALPWRRGSQERRTFQLNPVSTLPDGVAVASLPDYYSMKALRIEGAMPEEKLFIPIPGDHDEPRANSALYADSTEAGVLGARIGKGYLVYSGDVNPEVGSDQLIIALCKLGN
ncbi:hypothetical protein F5884DRAFT_897300 [Xylogone sp. PMI_703]|nr:hypothetical protein F5884DRAFT_897300 [Xylogone sp. PMI_703]